MARLNEDKYRNAILYFAEHISASELGKVKLMKLLYYLDFDHLEQYGHVVTGDSYRAKQMGPVPVNADTVIADMEAGGWLDVRYIDLGLNNPKCEYVPLRSYDPAVFTATEMDVLASVTQRWSHHSTNGIILASHGEPPWRRTPPEGIIDPQLVFLRSLEEGNMDDTNRPLEKSTMQLTVEQYSLRVKGQALVAQVEEFAAAHPEFMSYLAAAEQQIDSGEYDVFDENGWHER